MLKGVWPYVFLTLVIASGVMLARSLIQNEERRYQEKTRQRLVALIELGEDVSRHGKAVARAIAEISHEMK